MKGVKISGFVNFRSLMTRNEKVLIPTVMIRNSQRSMKIDLNGRLTVSVDHVGVGSTKYHFFHSIYRTFHQLSLHIL
jgi:hypothetical protein